MYSAPKIGKDVLGSAVSFVRSITRIFKIPHKWPRLRNFQSATSESRFMTHTMQGTGTKWKILVPRRNISTGLGQGQVLGPIVSYCASPVHCTNPGLLPVQCEYAITGIVLVTSSRTAIKNGSCQDSFGG